uniref:PH domain-containing protein n=1 Tax=Eptatretus burgeri TaxID=7764 RepID=A0A8C4QQL8_EPTBU
MGEDSPLATASKGLMKLRSSVKKTKSKLEKSPSFRFPSFRGEPEKLRASRSHDSLLAPGIEPLEINANEDAVIRPVHSSLSGQDNCFEVITPSGSRCFSCRTGAERDRWMENLRRSIQPNKDHLRRLETELRLCVMEAQGLPPKKRYFCQVPTFTLCTFTCSFHHESSLCIFLLPVLCLYLPCLACSFCVVSSWLYMCTSCTQPKGLIVWSCLIIFKLSCLIKSAISEDW